ncbi:calpain small subunit 1-like isoform X2 [Carettochelys insculpta]|uniref:calpain small subunit 1-like isoform X2 n=1 Tax=Carettochelys insculpta TaxID=44489 RepID=UPI003EBD5B7B
MEMGQCIYKQYDADQSGTIGSNELPGAFEAAGLWLNKQLYQMIVCRYSDEKGKQDFDNFISCLVLLDTLFPVTVTSSPSLAPRPLAPAALQ